MIKQIKEDKDLKDCAFTETEFHRLVDRIKDVSAIDFADETEVAKIKLGENVPFLTYDRLSEFRHFGSYEGAYYGQEFRNTIAGKIDAQSLNLRSFHYLLEYRKDGKIVIGSQYNGNYGDYDGLRKCFDYLLRGNEYKVVSRTFTSIRHLIGEGEPLELKINIRRPQSLEGAQGLFSTAAILAIRKKEYGEHFGDDVRTILVPALSGDFESRKKALAKLASDGEFLEINDSDIEGCSLLMKSDGRVHTV